MSRKRKVYSASFRAQVALSAMKGDKTINEVAAQFEVSPQRILKMKARLKERIEDIFQDERTRKKKPDGEATQEELFEQIGRLKMENDWLKKNLPCSIEAKRRMMEQSSKNITIARQCELLDFPRSTYYFQSKSESEENLKLMLAIDKYHMEYPAFGSRNIAKEFGIGRGRAKRLIRLMGIEAVSPKPRTMCPGQRHEIYPYLLRDLEITEQRPS